MPRWTHVAAIILAVAWLFLVTFNYYIVHKPFSVENARALIDAAVNVFVALALVALAAALGRRALRAFDFASPLERIVFHAGLGLGLISFATLALGLVGALSPILFWFLLFAFCFLLRHDLRAFLADLRSLSFPAPTRFEKFLAAFIFISLLLAFLFALTPPVAWDAQTYHLVIPKIALERGRIAPPPDIPYFSFPSLVEMLFLAALVLKGDIAAQVLHFAFLLLALGAVFAFAARYFNPRVAWLAAAMLAAAPSLLLVATWAYVDAALMLYAFAAFYLARVAIDKQSPISNLQSLISNNEMALLRSSQPQSALLAMTQATKWFALAGAFAGLAMGVKYTAAIVPVAVIGVLVIGNWGLVRRNWSLITVYCSLFTLFAAPWYLRNFFFTGNPVYPFLFGGPNWDAFRADWFGRFGTGYLNEPLKLLTAPWDATIYGVEGALGYEATVGGLMLALMPLLLLQSPKSKVQSPKSEADHSAIRNSQFAIRDLLIFSATLYAFWLLGIAGSKLLQQTRLLFPAFPVFALLAALAFEKLAALDLPQFSLQRFTTMLVIVILGLTLSSYLLGFAAVNPLAYLTGAESRGAFLARHLGAYDRAAQFINAQLPRDARVLALWEPRAYYLQRALQPDSILDAFPRVVARTRDADAILREWQRAGYTHVLLNRHGLNLLLTSQYDPISPADARVLQTILATRAMQLTGAPLEFIDGAIPNAEKEPYAIYQLLITDY